MCEGAGRPEQHICSPTFPWRPRCFFSFGGGKAREQQAKTCAVKVLSGALRRGIRPHVSTPYRRARRIFNACVRALPRKYAHDTLRCRQLWRFTGGLGKTTTRYSLAYNLEEVQRPLFSQHTYLEKTHIQQNPLGRPLHIKQPISTPTPKNMTYTPLGRCPKRHRSVTKALRSRLSSIARSEQPKRVVAMPSL